MTKHIKNLIEGARSVLVIKPEADYVRPSRKDTQRDAAKLSGDSKRVALDVRRALGDGKQVNYR